jgi:hypothetical protein
MFSAVDDYRLVGDNEGHLLGAHTIETL